ncbi:Os03g0237500 [Oryza sativa Japonica Group]|uniref:Os03g0237500 protein n=2 Tax=Oryza sativa subsp. japonica TaxID=39947 RepID=Q0DTM9_ORYSJ|nr:hypothetical protein EE612_016373 [Oryza sativa]BAF11409.1 Os03g0237500 [Oryza sativa Japonica Group]BAS83165.1 Os03g0237500 [Oryza sativa Japonica Group]|eukprot:NP_001049495.1 Os03g0237500 [Oryza sativa Japonica Group]
MYPQLLEPSILPTYKAAPRDPSSSSHSPRQLAAAAMFGVVFPDHSFPLDVTAFAQVAPNSWALDLSTLSLAAAPRSAVVFLLPALPPPPDGQRAERVALRVGENLFNFMQSFCGADGGKLVVPTDILDRWFRKFQERAKKDPSYLKTFDF